MAGRWERGFIHAGCKCDDSMRKRAVGPAPRSKGAEGEVKDDGVLSHRSSAEAWGLGA